MANQFTTGKRTEHDPATRDKMRAEKAAAQLERVMSDKDSSKEQIIAAAKALLPYGKSTYASIEERQINEVLDPAEQMQQLAHLLSQNPGLLKQLIDASPGLKAALESAISGAPVVVQAQQSAAA